MHYQRWLYNCMYGYYSFMWMQISVLKIKVGSWSVISFIKVFPTKLELAWSYAKVGRKMTCDRPFILSSEVSSSK